jgi:hypothetical protein
MKKNSLAALLVLLITVAAAHADTLKLRSGRIVHGTFLGGDSRQVSFLEENGQTKTFALTDVLSISFAAIPASPPPAPVLAPPGAPRPANATLLAGALIPVRLMNGLNTSSTMTGDRFTATLDSNLMAGDVVVARGGATVHGIVVKSEHARRLTGRSELQLALTDIVINGAARPISTSGFQQKGASEGAQTAKKTAGGAGLGAAIGAIGGNAGKGAAIGAVSGLGISMVKKGQPISLPAQTLLEFSLSQPTILPVQH